MRILADHQEVILDDHGPTRTWRPAEVALFASAVLLLRIVLVGTTKDDPVFRVPYLDGAFYHFWARSLAEGTGDFRDAYFLGPLYPYFCALLYALFEPNPLVVRLAQSCLGVLDAVLIMLLGGRLWGRAVGLSAAGLFALYGTFAFYEGLVVLEVFFTTLVLLAAYCLFAFDRFRHGTLWGAVLGFVLGLAVLTRGTALLLLPVFAWHIRRRSSATRPVVLLLLVCLLTLSPALIRNAMKGAGPVLTTNAGVNFYAGNNPDSNGRFREPAGIDFFTRSTFEWGDEGVPPALAERALSVESVAGTQRAADSSYWLKLSWQWISHNPGDFLLLWLRKAGLTLQSREIPQIESFHFHSARLRILRLFFVHLVIVFPLAAIGIWQARRLRAESWVAMLWILLLLLLPGVIFFVTGRYRLVAMPYLCLFAGFGFVRLWKWWSERRRVRVAWVTAAAVFLGFLTRLGGQPPSTAAGWENAQMAERVYALDDLDGAIRYQEEALRSLPNRYEVRLNLAAYWSERNQPGDAERAEEMLLQLSRERPQDRLLLYNLGTVYEQQGKLEKARRVYEAVLELDPEFTPARQGLQRIGVP